MFVALLSIVFGIVLIWAGFCIAGFSIGILNGWWRIGAGILVGACVSLFGLFIEFYMGWWGVLRAIIDYAKT